MDRKAEIFFTAGWLRMVGQELDGLLREHPEWAGCRLSLAEYFLDAPPQELEPPCDQPGVRLDLADGAAQLRRGLAQDETADVVVHSYWDDARKSALMPSGEAYQRFNAWRVQAGRLRRTGDPGPAAALLALLHDRIAARTK